MTMNANSSVRITMIDKFSSKIKAMRSNLNGFKASLHGSGDAVGKLGNKLGRLSTKLANLRTGFAAMALSRGLLAAVKESYEFEKAMNRVKAVTQETAPDMKILRDLSKELGLTTKFSATEAAQGMAMLGQRGLKTAGILKTLPTILKMATAGDLDLATASKMVTGTLNAFSMELDQSDRVANVYALTAARTASDMRSLNNAMINAAPLAAAAGIEFEELAALIGVMSNKNIMSSTSGTLLMNAFRNLIVPTRDAIKVLQGYGFTKNQFTDSEGQLRDFTGILELFHKHGVGVEDIFKIFQIRGAKATAAMMGTHEAVRKLRAEYAKQKDALDIMAETMLEGIVGTAVEAKSAWQGLKQAIGKALEPATKIVLKWVTTISRFIAKHPLLSKWVAGTLAVAAVLLTIITIIGVLIAAVASTVIIISIISSVVSVAGVLITGIIAGIISMGVMLVKGWDNIKWSGIAIWLAIKWVFKNIGKGLLAMGTWVWDLLKKFDPLVILTLKIKEHWQEITDMFSSVGKFFGFGKAELTSTLVSPGDVGNKGLLTRTESVERVEIVIETDAGSSASIRGGGMVPINLRALRGFGGRGF